MLYSVAKSGGGSVAEQTQWINAFAGKTGAQGKEGIAELTATMQIAMKNAPDAGAAAANFDHFLKSTFSKRRTVGLPVRAWIFRDRCWNISKTGST